MTISHPLSYESSSPTAPLRGLSTKPLSLSAPLKKGWHRRAKCPHRLGGFPEASGNPSQHVLYIREPTKGRKKKGQGVSYISLLPRHLCNLRALK